LIDRYPPLGGGPVFDIGGGNGVVAAHLQNLGIQVALLEPGISGARHARLRGIDLVICATTHSAEFPPGSLPAVGLFDVVEHIENDLEFLSHIHDLLAPNGRLYATVPAYQALWSQEDDVAGHYRRYDAKSFCALLAAAGFRVECHSYIFRFLPLPIFLLRALPFKLFGTRQTKPGATLQRDHAVKKGLVSRLIEKLLESEIDILKRGGSCSFGGSVVVVATKSPADSSNR